MPAATQKSPPVHVVVQELLDQVRGAWRFRWVALAMAWCVALVLWFAIFMIPNKYEATAKVFVDTGTTLSEATRGIGLGDDVENQIERVRQAILGTPELERVANATNLMAGAVTAAQQQNVIDNLRRNLDIVGYLAPQRASAALFTISYKDPDRARAEQVVGKLLDSFVQGTLFTKNQGSRQAVTFLNRQIAAYGKKLNGIEQQLASFQRRNIGLLPNTQGSHLTVNQTGAGALTVGMVQGQSGSYFGELQADLNALTRDRQRLYVAERTRAELAAELRAGQQFTVSAHGAPVASGAGAAALDSEQQIDQDEARLDAMLLKYTDQYPSVVALRRTIAELKAREKRQMQAARKGDVGAASALGLSANPVYQRLQEKYNAAQVGIAEIEQNIANTRQQVATLRAEINIAPEVQAEYTQLTRNYTVTRKQYDALLARLDSTRLGQQAASTGTVKFQIIDPPTAQFKPVAPKRVRLILLALFAALAAGIGTAYLLHLLRPVFVSTRQLGAVTGLTVLGAVSMAWADRHRAERKRGQVLYACAAAALVIMSAAVLALHAHIANLAGDLRS